jgi:hypothetical protein
MKNMRTRSNYILAIALAVLTVSTSRADSYYPKAVSMRTFGTDQGNVKDCQAEADINSLEGIFASRGLDFVRLSLFYRHAANWSSSGAADQNGVSLDLSDADKALISQVGEILPDFMWPEDARGYSPLNTGTRPHPAEAVIYDPAFPKAESLGFSDAFYTFKPGYANSSSFAALKAAVAQGNAVTLSIQGDLLQPSFDDRWDRTTGLLVKPYAWSQFAQSAQDHAVAVVGWDDSLYADQGYATPGALIIRNSWNDGSEIGSAIKDPTPQQKIDLAKMKLKLSGADLPGYYAIPYQYVIDLATHALGGFDVLQLNYEAYAEKYVEISKNYEVVETPYVCDGVIVAPHRMADAARRKVIQYGSDLQTLSDASRSKADRTAAAKRVYAAAFAETGSREMHLNPGEVFQYARLARNAALKQDRVADFYGGKFLSYYCPSNPMVTAPQIWPTPKEYADAGYLDALNRLSIDGDSYDAWASYLRAISALTAADTR